jgi:hypothetical protein
VAQAHYDAICEEISGRVTLRVKSHLICAHVAFKSAADLAMTLDVILIVKLDSGAMSASRRRARIRCLPVHVYLNRASALSDALPL